MEGGNTYRLISLTTMTNESFPRIRTGYGFVDFESPFAAETAVKALQAQGIQAQMAKVGSASLSKGTPSLYPMFIFLPMYS